MICLYCKYYFGKFNLLLNGLVNPTGVTGQTATVAREIASNQIFGTSTYSGTLSSIAPGIYNTTADGAPKAYMVWTLFDNEFNLVKSSSGMLRVPNTPDVLKNLSQLDITMDRGGYFYAYLVNESSMNVYFDDFQVTHNTGKVLEENHYYPFGMLNAQLSVQPTDKPLNYYKYNGKELQKELNLEWLDYGARFYDAQVGRWHSVDPMSEKYRKWSLYNYVMDNPMRFIDPDGMAVTDPLKKTRIAASLSLTTGKFGASLDLFGYGISGSYANGGASSKITFFVDFGTKSMPNVGVSYTETQILSEKSLTLGGINGKKETIKEKTREISTKDGASKTEDKKYKTIESGGIGSINTTEEAESSSTGIQAGIGMNLLFLGMEAEVSVKPKEENINTPKPQVLSPSTAKEKKSKIEKEVKNHY